MITFDIITHDGTLFPSRAKYKGCTWFSDKCSRVAVRNVITRVKKQIMYRLNNLNKINLDKAFMIKCECPYVPEEKQYKKNPKFEVLCLKLGHIDEKPTIEQSQTAMLFNVAEELDKHGLFIDTIRSNITDINLESGDVILRCPKIPKDTDAKYDIIDNYTCLRANGFDKKHKRHTFCCFKKCLISKAAGI